MGSKIQLLNVTAIRSVKSVLLRAQLLSMLPRSRSYAPCDFYYTHRYAM